MHKIKVRGVIVLEERIFLVRETKKGFFYLPGGTLADGESLKECLMRELYEELGVRAVVGDLMTIREFRSRDEYYLDFWFLIDNPLEFCSIDKTIVSHGFENQDEWFYLLSDLSNEMVLPPDL